MNKPLSLILPTIEAVWLYEPMRFQKMEQALGSLDYSLALQLPASHKSADKAAPAAMWDDDDDDPPSKPYRVENGIAILSLSGPMTKVLTWLSYYYGGTSTQILRNLLRMAVADPDVQGILLIVYSPGGQVAGTQDLANDIAWASTVKPTLALGEDLICSAAYWAGSQAGAGLYLNNTSCTAGSVGTVMGVLDTHKADEEAGLKVTMITSGDRKAIGASGTEITEAQLAYLQDYINSVNRAFVGSVQTTRKLSAAQLADVTRAGVYVGQDAVKIGLADGILSLDECKALLQQKIKRAQSARGTGANTVTIVTKMEAPPVGEAEATPPAPESLTDLAAGDNAPAASLSEAGNAPAITPPAASSPATTPSPRTMPASASVPRAGGEGKTMKEKLVRILAALGLNKMAVAIVSSTDESPEALAQTMSEQVHAEVKERIQNHPLMLACAGAGINDVAALERVLDMKALGERHLSELRDDAKAQCVRAYGSEVGAKISAQVDKMGAHEVKTMRDAWLTQADEKFKLGEGGQAASRTTAPSAVAALNAEETKTVEPKTKWEQLTQEQRDVATRMGYAISPEAKEKFAGQYILDAGK